MLTGGADGFSSWAWGVEEEAPGVEEVSSTIAEFNWQLSVDNKP